MFTCSLQKQLTELGEQVLHINKEEELFNWTPSLFPQLDVIRSAVEPYEKLFMSIQSWHTAEKRFLDGTLKILNAEDTQASVSSYTKLTITYRGPRGERRRGKEGERWRGEEEEMDWEEMGSREEIGS